MSAAADVDSPVDLIASLVERAALDGSTCVPAPVLAAALRGIGVDSPGPSAEAAVEAGRVAAYLDERLFGHPHWAPLEEQLAEHLVELVTRSGPDAVRVVDAPRGSALPAVPGDAVVVQHAHRLGLAEAAELLARLVRADGDAAAGACGRPGDAVRTRTGSGAGRPGRQRRRAASSPDPTGSRRATPATSWPGWCARCAPGCCRPSTRPGARSSSPRPTTPSRRYAGLCSW